MIIKTHGCDLFNAFVILHLYINNVIYVICNIILLWYYTTETERMTQFLYINCLQYIDIYLANKSYWQLHSKIVDNMTICQEYFAGHAVIGNTSWMAAVTVQWLC